MVVAPVLSSAPRIPTADGQSAMDSGNLHQTMSSRRGPLGTDPGSRAPGGYFEPPGNFLLTSFLNMSRSALELRATKSISPV